MTRDDLQLDPEFFLSHQPLTLFRLARARYANLSGIGAATAPGRWNRPGQEAIYTSTEISVPLLERLVHTSKNLIPSNLALMRIRLAGDWKMHKNAVFDPATDGSIWIYRDLATAREAFRSDRDQFAAGLDPFAVAVPSVIVPVWNVVLYPRGHRFWEHVSLESVEKFEFDPRLFSDGAEVERQEAG